MRIILAYIQSQLILILYWNYNHATQKAIMAKFDKIPNVPGTDKIFCSKLLVFLIGNFISLEICRLKSLLIKSLIRIRSKYLSFWWNIWQSKIEEQSTLKMKYCHVWKILCHLLCDFHDLLMPTDQLTNVFESIIAMIYASYDTIYYIYTHNQYGSYLCP